MDIDKGVLRILQTQRIRTVGMLADMARVDLFQIGILMGDASTIISAAKGRIKQDEPCTDAPETELT